MPSHTRSSWIVSTVVAATFLTGSAFADEPAAATAATAAVATSVTSAPPKARKPLDLRAPHITHLYTSDELNRILAASFRQEELEGVEVEGEREIPRSTPDVWPGIFAPFWAMMNPSQAWRILAPLPPDQTRGMQNVRYDATEAYVLEPAANAPNNIFPRLAN